MVVDVMGLLRPLGMKRLDGLEELAARLAAGTAVPPEEVAAVLDRSRCGAADLQSAVDRHTRVADLRRTVAEAVPMRKRLAAIHAELRQFAEARAAASRREDEAIARHYEEEMTLRHRCEEADRAAADLLTPKNLTPGDAAKLTGAIARADEAEQALTAATGELADRRRRLRIAEEEQVKAVEEAKFNHLNADLQELAKRWTNAVKARGEQAAEAEQAVAAATREHEAARRERDAVRAAIEKAVSAASSPK